MVRSSVRALVVGLCGTVIGCASRADVEAPAPPGTEGDRMLAAGHDRAAADAYLAAQVELEDPETRARLAVMQAIALLGTGDPGAERSALRILVRTEMDHRPSVWGRVAGIIAADLSRETALRETLVRLSADLADARSKLARATVELDARNQRGEADVASIAALETQGRRLEKRVEVLEAELVLRERELEDLRAELAALKRVDLSRDP